MILATHVHGTRLAAESHEGLRVSLESADVLAMSAMSVPRVAQSYLASRPSDKEKLGAGGKDDNDIFRILESLKAGEIVLPAAPVVLTKMRASMQSPSVTATQMASLVAQDQRLASEVLRLANSAHYARAGRISDLQGAVTRIGFKQIHQIVETVLLRSAFDVSNAWTLNCLTGIWRRSVATALACRALAAASPSSASFDGGLAYLSGLFCDVGAGFLLSLLDKAAGEGGLHEAKTLQAIAANHQSAGKRILEVWEMEPVVQLAAGSHHHDAKQLRGPGLYQALVSVGGMVANLLGLDADVTATRPLQEQETKPLLLALRVPSAQLPKIAEAIKPDFEAITSAG